MADGIPPERLRALLRFLGPQEMTPTAKRQLTLLCDEYSQPAPDTVGDQP